VALLYGEVIEMLILGEDWILPKLNGDNWLFPKLCGTDWLLPKLRGF
jgi:hypothetical protein